MPDGYNQNFTFNFNTIEETQQESFSVPVTAQVVQSGTVVAQINQVTEYTFFSPNITYPDESDEDTTPVRKVRALGTDGFDRLEPIYNESTGELELRYQYDLKIVEPGDEFIVELDANLTQEFAQLQDGTNYTVSTSGNTVTFTFNDEFTGADQGIISVKVNLNEVENSDEYTYNWSLNGEEDGYTFFIKKPGDQQSPISSEKSNKLTNGTSNLSSHIDSNFNEETKEQSLIVKDSILTVPLSYTLNYETIEATNLSIVDTIDPLFEYDLSSFTATIDSWDESGWNKVTTTLDNINDLVTISGDSFTIEGLELPANSRVTIKYNAFVKSIDAYQSHVDELLVEADLGGESGNVSSTYDNTAIFNGTLENTAQYNLNKNVNGEVGPGWPGAILNKNVNPTSVVAEFDEEGNFIPIPVTYTINLEMSKFAADNIKQLEENMLLTDTIQSEHNVTLDAITITSTDGGIPTQAGTVDSSDATVGNYNLTENGFTFNAGKVSADYTITLTGHITSLNESTVWGEISAFDYYDYQNEIVAKSGEFQNTRNTKTTVIDHNNQTDLNNGNVFSKGHQTNPEIPVLGEPLEVIYTLKVNENPGQYGVDVSKSTITDALDPIFDLTQGFELTVTDAWSGQSTDYITTDLSGNILTIDFADNMPEDLKSARWVLELKLTTYPITNQTEALIRNSASLTGSDLDFNYSSSTQTSGQTTGGELLVYKTISDLTNIDYVKNYALELDEDGYPVHDEFNYKIELIPQVDYKNVSIIPLVDILPDQVEFIGLIGDWQDDTADVNSSELVYSNNSGSVEVTYADGQLRISNDNSTFGNGAISIRFRVRLKDPASLDLGDLVSNSITNTDPPANIVVVDPGSYPLSITKNDSETGETIADENNVARFKLEKIEENGQELTEIYNELQISNGSLVTPEGKSPIVKSIGNYLLTELIAPTGYVLSEDPIEITVTENGTSPASIVVQNTPYVEPVTLTHTIIKEWTVEEGTETPVVSVTLYDGEVAVEGSTVELNAANDYTYTWTELSTEGNYTAVETAVEGFEQVSTTTAEGVTTIVNAPEEVVPEPTKTYAVGDYTWIDTNKDGIQDTDEPVLTGVIVELYDGEGTKLAETTTDENGFYLFDELEAGDYQVNFTLTPEQAELYEFTTPDAGDDAQDSDANPETGFTVIFTLDETNEALTTDYATPILATQGIDPTWDAGVIVKEVPIDPSKPSVSVGDYVWIDVNKDGLQDEGEPGIPGVVLTIEDENGNPVVDINGNPIEPTTTDNNGRYIFENLPINNIYVVRIDVEASKDALVKYVPTLNEANYDNSIDSSTWFATSTLLNQDGQHDPTLDFGFVLADEELENPEESTESKESEEKSNGKELPNTGETSFVWLSTVALILGLTLLIFGSRKKA